MDIFLNSIYLPLFNSLTTISISGIFQSAYSVHSPMLNYFLLTIELLYFSPIELEFSLGVEKMTWRFAESESVDW